MRLNRSFDPWKLLFLHNRLLYNKEIIDIPTMRVNLSNNIVRMKSQSQNITYRIRFFKNWSPYCIQISLVFFLTFFFFSRDSLRIPSYSTFYSHASLAYLKLGPFFRHSLFLIILIVLRSTGQLFCRMPLSWGLTEIFSYGLTGVVGFWKEDMWSVILSTWCQGRM